MSEVIKLYYQNVEDNFGDVLSKSIVEQASKSSVEFSVFKYCDLVAIGSLGERVVRRRLKRWLMRFGRPLDIWGTGFLMPGDSVNNRFARIHALRGKLSASRLSKKRSDIALGDPALLCSRVFQVNACDHGSKIVCLPHLHDPDPLIWVSQVQKLFPHHEVIALKLDQPLQDIMDAIVNAEFVLTTAMHPYIVAHSFDVPVLYLQTGWSIHIGGDYKLQDYVSVFGRKELPAMSLDRLVAGQYEAKELLDVAEQDRVPRECIRQVQAELLDSFPYRYRA